MRSVFLAINCWLRNRDCDQFFRDQFSCYLSDDGDEVSPRNFCPKTSQVHGVKTYCYNIIRTHSYTLNQDTAVVRGSWLMTGSRMIMLNRSSLSSHDRSRDHPDGWVYKQVDCMKRAIPVQTIVKRGWRHNISEVGWKTRPRRGCEALKTQKFVFF